MSCFTFNLFCIVSLGARKYPSKRAVIQNKITANSNTDPVINKTYLIKDVFINIPQIIDRVIKRLKRSKGTHVSLLADRLDKAGKIQRILPKDSKKF